MDAAISGSASREEKSFYSLLDINSDQKPTQDLLLNSENVTLQTGTQSRRKNDANQAAIGSGAVIGAESNDGNRSRMHNKLTNVVEI